MLVGEWPWPRLCRSATEGKAISAGDRKKIGQGNNRLADLLSFPRICFLQPPENS